MGIILNAQLAVDMRSHTVRIAQCVCYRHLHVRTAELSLDCTIAELHHRVDNALWVDSHLNLVSSHIEQPSSLDYLKAFVHHRCRVDGDLGSHIPVWMFQCLCRCHVAHLLVAESTERTATCRDDELVDRVVYLALQALEDCRMFAIDWENRHMIVGNELLYETTCHYERFLVGKGYGLVRLDSRDRRTQARKPHHGGYDDVDRLCLHHLTQGIGTSPHLDRQI